jgi:hypothetical protein
MAEVLSGGKLRVSLRFCFIMVADSLEALGRLAMTNNLRDNPQHWRDLAEQARSHAIKTEDPESRRMMIGIADGYDNLARRAEAKLREITMSK